MSTVQGLQETVSHLPPEDMAAFRLWFTEFDESRWNQQLCADVAAGRLDPLAEEALKDLHEGRCTDL